MSLQAHLADIEHKTGLTPREFSDEFGRPIGSTPA